MIAKLSLLWTVAASLSAATIFSTLGPGDSFSASGLGFGQSPNGFLSVGAGFTPTQTSVLSSFDLVLRNGSAPNVPNVLNTFLMGSLSGNPSGVIESLTFNIVIPANAGIVNVNSVLKPTLVAGTQYFVIVNDGASPAFGGFSLNSIGVVGPVVQGTNINALTASNQQELAFRVNGAPVSAVPEPISLLLTGAGLLGIRLYRRVSLREGSRSSTLQ